MYGNNIYNIEIIIKYYLQHEMLPPVLYLIYKQITCETCWWEHSYSSTI
jgi:hypothetical protein